jgi:hypothetical protein
MIKHDHENESSQTIFAKSKFESHFSSHISHFETKRKTRYQHIFAATRLNIHSKQIFIWESSLICCYVLVLSTSTSHLVISSPLSIKQACLTVLITLQSIEFLDSLIMLRFSASELRNEQKISDENSIERFTKRFISWYSHHDLKTT